MDQAKTVLAEILAMVHSRKGKREIKAKYVIQECIQCDQPAVVGCRGLCQGHYRQFKHAREVAAESASLTKKEIANGVTLEKKTADIKDAFDKEQVRKGMILSSRQGKHSKAPSDDKRAKKPNPFMRTA